MYILIAMLLGYQGTAVTLTHIEYSSEIACINAEEKLHNLQLPEYHTMITSCTAKGTE